VIPIFVAQLLAGKPPVIFGDGEQSRDFSYVDNVVEANLCAAHAEGGAGQVFNIACGQRHTLNHLVADLNEILGTDIAPEYTDERIGDVKHSLADISAARETLGYQPQVDFHAGLEMAIDWYKKSDPPVT
jgi:UDP-glucose 4-epimerase